MKTITLGLMVLLFSFSALANGPLSAEKAIEEFEASEDVQMALDELEDQGYTIEEEITATLLRRATFSPPELFPGDPQQAHYLVTQLVTAAHPGVDILLENTLVAHVHLVVGVVDGDEEDENTVKVFDEREFGRAIEWLSRDDDDDSDLEDDF